MKKLNKNSIVVTLAVFLALGFAGPIAALAAGPAPVNLLSISTNNLAILSETGITNTGSHTTSITGNIGSSPITAAAMNNVFCSEITGTIYGVDAAYTGSGSTTCFAGDPGVPAVVPPDANKTSVDDAVLDMAIAYTDAAGRPLPDGTELYGGNIGGQTFAPGLYKWSTDVNIPTSITLSGGASDVWIFQIAGNLNVASGGSVPSGIKVILSGGALASNVFWQVGGTTGATLGTYSTFNGNILSAKQIIIQTGAILNGRALAQTQVTLDGNVISSAGPVVPPVVPPSTEMGGGIYSYTPIVVPLIGMLKVPTPLALPGGSGKVTYNYTVWNVGGKQALTNILLTDDKCSPVTFISGDTNSNGKLDPGETWNYSCTATLSKTTTNTAVVIGYSDDIYRQSAIATSISTVIVGGATPGLPNTGIVVAPLINIIKVPSRLTPLPFGGGNIMYNYTVTNPGVVPMSNVTVTDDKCAPVSGPFGDTNGNRLLDPGEAWSYACQTNVPVSTMDTAKATGQANGFTAVGYGFATVLVATAPTLPNTGFPPEERNNLLDSVLLAGVLMIVSVSIVVVVKKRTI